MIKLVSKFGDVFHDHLGITNVLKHEIRTMSAKLMNVKNRQIPYSVEETVKKEMSYKLNMNIIETSDSRIAHLLLSCPRKTEQKTSVKIFSC